MLESKSDLKITRWKNNCGNGGKRRRYEHPYQVSQKNVANLNKPLTPVMNPRFVRGYLNVSNF